VQVVNALTNNNARLAAASIPKAASFISRLLLGFFVNPVLYEIVARVGDVLQA
jgi:hypothetical protein